MRDYESQPIHGPGSVLSQKRPVLAVCYCMSSSVIDAGYNVRVDVRSGIEPVATDDNPPCSFDFLPPSEGG